MYVYRYIYKCIFVQQKVESTFNIEKILQTQKSQYISLWSDLQTKILTSDIKWNKTRVEKICNQIQVSDFICRFH